MFITWWEDKWNSMLYNYVVYRMRGDICDSCQTSDFNELIQMFLSEISCF